MTLVGRRSHPAATLAATAAAVIVGDWVSKVLALRFGWGLSIDVQNVALSVAAVAVIAVLSVAVCGALSVHDRAAPVTLGLIVGAGVANAGDALAPPQGVVDFIALRVGGGVVLNLADVAVLVGVCLCARTAYRLVLALRREGGSSR